MNKTAFGFAAAAVAAAALALPSFAETKVATIDIEKIVRLHPNTERDKKQLEQTLKDYTAQAEVLEKSAVDARKAFEAAATEVRNPALSDSARKRAEEKARAKYDEAKEAEERAISTKRSLQRNLTNEEIRMLKETVGKVQEVVEAYAKEKGIDLVLPTSGSKLGIAPAVFWSDDSLDITATIMTIMKIEERPLDDDDDTEAPAAALPAAAVPSVEKAVAVPETEAK